MRRSRLRESGKCWRTSSRNSTAGKIVVSVRKTVGVGSAIDYGIRAPLLHEQFLEGDRGRRDVLGERFARLGGARRDADRCVETRTTVSPLLQ